MLFNDIIFSVTTGFAGSIAVVLFLYSLKPKVSISECISEYINDGQTSYGFKIINKTPYPIIEVSIELSLLTYQNVPGGSVFVGKNIALIKNNFFHISKFNVQDRDAEYALRVGTLENIRQLWTTENQSLKLSVIAKHSLSGFTSVTSQTFNALSCIKLGKHKAGNHLTVESVQ